jgi:hypothetical protein
MKEKLGVRISVGHLARVVYQPFLREKFGQNVSLKIPDDIFFNLD